MKQLKALMTNTSVAGQLIRSAPLPCDTAIDIREAPGSQCRLATTSKYTAPTLNTFVGQECTDEELVIVFRPKPKSSSGQVQTQSPAVEVVDAQLADESSQQPQKGDVQTLDGLSQDS